MARHRAEESNRIDVVAGVVIREGRILLIRRAPGMSFEGLWAEPGGKAEPRETIASALLREMLEEIGVAFDPMPRFLFADDFDPPVVSRPYRIAHAALACAGHEDRRCWSDGCPIGGIAIRIAPREASGYCWFAPDELLAMAERRQLAPATERRAADLARLCG